MPTIMAAVRGRYSSIGQSKAAAVEVLDDMVVMINDQASVTSIAKLKVAKILLECLKESVDFLLLSSNKESRDRRNSYSKLILLM